MPHFARPAAHGVAAVTATAFSSRPGAESAFAGVSLVLTGHGEPLALDIFMPASAAGYAQRLAEAINAALTDPVPATNAEAA